MDAENPHRTPAQPRHLPAAQPVHHGLPVLGLLRHRRRHRRQLRTRRLRGVRGHAVRHPRWPRGAADPHRKRLRQGIRQPRRHGVVRRGAGHRRLPVGRRRGCSNTARCGGAWAGWLPSLYAVCAALRLARFNMRHATADKRFFEGLPSPSAAAVVSAFIWSASEWREPGLPGLILAALVTASAGALMVSQFGYNSFKTVNAEGPVRFATFLLVPLGFILIAMYPLVCAAGHLRHATRCQGRCSRCSVACSAAQRRTPAGSRQTDLKVQCLMPRRSGYLKAAGTHRLATAPSPLAVRDAQVSAHESAPAAVAHLPAECRGTAGADSWDAVAGEVAGCTQLRTARMPQPHRVRRGRSRGQLAGGGRGARRR